MANLEKVCPFGEMLSFRMRSQEIGLDQLDRMTEGLHKSYQAWMLVRKGVRNPYFSEGTGLEGYFAGIIARPEDVKEELIKAGGWMLDAATKQHRFGGFPDTIFRIAANQELTMQDRKKTVEVLGILDGVFGAELAKLRANLLRCPEAVEFREQTYQMLGGPGIHHVQENGGLKMVYSLPSCSEGGKQILSLSGLSGRDAEGLAVAMGIGRLGVPALRVLVLGR